MITRREDLAAAIAHIREDVYATARAERWPIDDMQREVRRRIEQLTDDTRAHGRGELADVITRHYGGEK